MWVRVIENAHQYIRIEYSAKEHVLAAVVASNITAIPLFVEHEMEGSFKCLSALEPGQKARVIGISTVCRAPERRRMFDLGILPGTIVKVEMESPSGDPTAYRIRGTLIAMRKEQAEMIQVGPLENGVAP